MNLLKSYGSWRKAFKKDHPNLFFLGTVFLIFILPALTFWIRPYVDFIRYPTPQLEYSLAGSNFLIGHITSFNLYVDETPWNLSRNSRYILDIKVQNKYDKPLMTKYNFTEIDGIEINVSYNRQYYENQLSINPPDWHHFYLDTYVSNDTVSGEHKFCFMVMEALIGRNDNNNKVCKTVFISPQSKNRQRLPE